MRPLASALVVAFALGLACCGGQQHPAPDKTALIEFDSPVRDAEVWLDGTFYPGALGRGLRVKPGPHRIEIRHDDYFTQYLEVNVAAGQHQRLKVDLAEVLP